MLTVNHRSCRKVRPSAASGMLICAAAAALVLPVRAHAQLTGSASATTQYESNSNLFALDTGAAQSVAENPSRTTDITYGASFDGAYAFGQQQLVATATATHFDYPDFSDLSHNEYSFTTGLNWKLGDALDGKLGVARTYAMVPFQDLTGSPLTFSIQTSQQETFQMGIKLDPEWKLEGSASTSRSTQPVVPALNQPQPVAGATNQELTQTSGTAALEYSGFGPLTSGLVLGYGSGDSGAATDAQNLSYTQSSAGLSASYMLGRTSFDGQVGYSRRTAGDGLDNVSGVTGLIDFKDKLTPKTSFTIKIERNIQTLYLNLGSEVDTDAGVSVSWQATYKIGVSVGYVYTYRDFPGPLGGALGSHTIDRDQNANIAIAYLPFRWLSVTPYANITTRSSNTPGRDFNGNVYGISLTATVGQGRAKQ